MTDNDEMLNMNLLMARSPDASALGLSASLDAAGDIVKTVRHTFRVVATCVHACALVFVQQYV